jgi:hypothetical protein
MRFHYPALLSFVLLSGCDTDVAPKPADEFVGPLQVQALESREGQARKLYLNFQDQGQYACSNYGLGTRYERANNQLNFAFTGVVVPAGFCLTSTGPARASFDISEFGAGTYSLRLQAGSRSTTGTLEIQKDVLRITSNDPNIVNVTLPELRFMPKNIVWGYATTMLPQTQASVEVLRDSLQRLGATPTTLTPGVYSQFTIAANGLPEPPQVSVGARALLLLATYSGSPGRIQAYVKRANAATPGLNLWLNTSGI